RYEWLNRGRAIADGEAAVTWAAGGDPGAGARVDAPLVRGDDGKWQTRPWHDTILEMVERLRQLAGSGVPVHVVTSPFRANEDAAFGLRLAGMVGAASAVYRSPRAPDEE